MWWDAKETRQGWTDQMLIGITKALPRKSKHGNQLFTCLIQVPNLAYSKGFFNENKILPLLLSLFIAFLESTEILDLCYCFHFNAMIFEIRLFLWSFSILLQVLSYCCCCAQINSSFSFAFSRAKCNKD